jgi:hypothetical protein
MKKTILTILLATGIFTVEAQTLSFGVKGGLNVAKLTNTDHSKPRTSAFIGLFTNIAFDKKLSIQPELAYSGQGTKYDDFFNIKTTVKLAYINIPVMVQYRIVPAFYLEAGPQLGFLTSAKHRSGRLDVDIKDDYKSVEFGLGFGLGYQFPIGVGIGARYMFGLSNAFDLGEIVHKNAVAQAGVFYTFHYK